MGRHNVAVRAVCPGFPPVFSEPANASWTVVDGRPTNTSIQGPVLTNDPSPTFTLGANKGDCSYNYSLDGGPVLTQEAATTGSLTAQWLSEIPAVWPHSRGTIAFSSSMGIGTKFVVKMDGQPVDTVVATGGAEAHLELVDLEEGTHTLSVVAEANGKSHEITSAFKVGAAIDTQIFGGPVDDYALFKLKSLGADHFEYKLDRWQLGVPQGLQVGAGASCRWQVRVASPSGEWTEIKDPVPARFIWNVNEAVEVQLDNPPVDTKAPQAKLLRKQLVHGPSPSALTVAQNKQVHPAQSAHWRRGITRCGCGRAKPQLRSSLRGCKRRRPPLAAWKSVWRWETQVGTSCML